MPFRVTGAKTGNCQPARIRHARSRMDPDLLALALSQTEDIERMRAGGLDHQAREPEETGPVPEPDPKRKGDWNRNGRPGTAVCSKCGRSCRPGTAVCCKCKRGEYHRRYRETHNPKETNE